VGQFWTPMVGQFSTPIDIYTILQVLSVTIFERMPLLQALTDIDYRSETDANNNQLFLFN
jgi:hypothetical protein